jgi:hypothetical protein
MDFSLKDAYYQGIFSGSNVREELRRKGAKKQENYY